MMRDDAPTHVPPPVAKVDAVPHIAGQCARRRAQARARVTTQGHARCLDARELPFHTAGPVDGFSHDARAAMLREAADRRRRHA